MTRASHSCAPAETPHAGYRPCVGLMLIRPGGLVFVGERHGPVRAGWQMPQGGIDPGETPIDAAWRELEEEVGTDKAELLAESRFWYAYDLPPELAPAVWGGRYRGQTQKWYAFRFAGTDHDIDLAAHQPEFTRWRWVAADEAIRRVWPPKRPIYEAIVGEFRHLLA